MIIMNEKGHLTSQTIDEWSAEAETLYTQALKGKQKPSHTVRLGLEETLLRFREKYGTDEECNIKCYKNGHLLRFVISQRGDHSNPLNIDEFDLSYDLLEKFDLKPRYTYKSRRRLNVVTFPINLPPRKNTLLIRLGIAVILAILTKLLLSVLPDSVGSGYIQPATRTHKTRQLYVLFFLPDSQVPFYLIFNDSVNHQFERFTEGRIE